MEDLQLYVDGLKTILIPFFPVAGRPKLDIRGKRQLGLERR